jgi:uncharacterized damage-inducible protein DinB
LELESIRKLYAYNHWANERVLVSASGLSHEEFSRNLGGSFGSLWGTLVHIFGVEWLYPQRWKGNSPPALPTPDRFSDFADLRSYWDHVRAEQLQFLAGLTEERLRQRVDYINFHGETYGYPLSDQMRHLVNHSTYHRGQVSLQLRSLQKEPLATDYLMYLDECNERRA